MRFRGSVFGIAVLIFGALVLQAPPAAAVTNFAKPRGADKIRIEEPMPTLTVGERLLFDVYWMGFHVGLGSLEVKEKILLRGREAFHVIAIARTNEFLSKLCPIYDEIHTYIDAETHASLEFRKTLSEGLYRADERTVYDAQNGKAYYESFKSGEKKEIEIGRGVQDAVSAFYWFRLQDIEIGQSVRTLVNSRERNWDLEIKVLKAEIKELRGERLVETVLVEPKTRYEGILDKRGRAWVSFSVDRQRLPVWIKIKTPFGPVNGILKEETSPPGLPE